MVHIAGQAAVTWLPGFGRGKLAGVPSETDVLQAWKATRDGVAGGG